MTILTTIEVSMEEGSHFQHGIKPRSHWIKYSIYIPVHGNRKFACTGIDNPRCNQSSLNYMLMTVTCSDYRIYSRHIADSLVSLCVPSVRREREERGFLFNMERDRTNEQEEEME